MKKLIITTAILLGFGLTTFAGPNGGGLFQRGDNSAELSFMNRDGEFEGPALPYHGQSENQEAPVGSGIAVLVGLGAAYLVGKKRREE